MSNIKKNPVIKHQGNMDTINKYEKIIRIEKVKKCRSKHIKYFQQMYKKLP